MARENTPSVAIHGPGRGLAPTRQPSTPHSSEAPNVGRITVRVDPCIPERAILVEDEGGWLVAGIINIGLGPEGGTERGEGND